MSYNPISFNVIRQSIRWAGLPKARVYRDGPCKKLTDGTMTAMYVLEFPYDLVERWMDINQPRSKNPWRYFSQAISGSFSTDIVPMGREIDYRHNVVRQYIYVRVPRRDRKTGEAS
jgi:hypothetical protein